MTLDTNWVKEWITAAAAAIGEHKQELNTLDREIGDGDHGENMDRGLKASVAALEKLPDDATPNAALRSRNACFPSPAVRNSTRSRSIFPRSSAA